MPHLRRKLSAIGRAKNGSASHQQSAQRLVIKRNELLWLKQPFIASENANRFPATFGRSFSDSANHRIQSGTISPTRYDSNFLAHVFRELAARVSPPDFHLHAVSPAIVLIEVIVAADLSHEV